MPAGGPLRRLQLPGDRLRAGPGQSGLHQALLRPSRHHQPQHRPDSLRRPPSQPHRPAQRDRDGGQEPLGDAFCPQVCDEVHVLTTEYEILCNIV